MMCQPCGPDLQSDKFLGIAASKHSSTDQQFFNLLFNDWAIVNCAWARQVGSLPLIETGAVADFGSSQRSAIPGGRGLRFHHNFVDSLTVREKCFCEIYSDEEVCAGVCWGVGLSVNEFNARSYLDRRPRGLTDCVDFERRKQYQFDHARRSPR